MPVLYENYLLPPGPQLLALSPGNRETSGVSEGPQKFLVNEIETPWVPPNSELPLGTQSKWD
jgi:hypothetical protein